MIKEYYPIWGEKITEQEALQLKNFKIRWIDGLYNLPFKEQHVINNDGIEFIEYYIYDGENEEEVLHTLSRKSERFDIVKRVVVENFIVDTSKGYIRGNHIPSVGKVVYHADDPDAHHICSQILDNKTHLPIHDRTVKYWYDTDENGKKYQAVRCWYEENGSLEVAIDQRAYDSEQDWDYFTLQGFYKLQRTISEDISYYQNGNLLPEHLLHLLDMESDFEN